MSEATGRKDDGAKGGVMKDRWDLLPLGPVREIVRVLTFGAQKYAPGNWMKVDDAVERYYAALMRHLHAWREGESFDSETKLHHLAHAGCDLLFCLWFELKCVGPIVAGTRLTAPPFVGPGDLPPGTNFGREPPPG